MKKVQKKKSSLQKKNGSAPKSEISMLADEMRAGFEMVNKKMDDGFAYMRQGFETLNDKIDFVDESLSFKIDGLSNRIDDLSKK